MKRSCIVVAAMVCLQLVSAISFPQNWIQTNPTVTAKTIELAAYGDGKWVFWAGTDIASSFPQVISSPDWVNFKTQTFPNQFPLNDIAYGDAAGFIGAFGNISAVSDDGVTWTFADLSEECTMDEITYGNGMYAGLTNPTSGTTVQGCKSTDGKTWTTFELPLTVVDGGYYAIEYFNDKFYFWGSGNVTGYSYDLVKWQFETVTFQDNIFYMFMSKSGSVVAAGLQDGSEIVFLEQASSGKWDVVGTWNMYNPSMNMEMAVGNGIVMMWTGQWVMTEDFVTYDNVTIPWTWYDMDTYPAIKFVNDRFVIFGMSGEMAWSTDGDTWTEVSEGLTDQLYDVFFQGSQFVIAQGYYGYANAIYTSADGQTWTVANPSFSTGDLQWNSGLGEYVGSSGDSIYHGTDLANLQFVSAPTWVDSWAIGNGMWVLQDDNPEWSGSTADLFAADISSSTTWHWTNSWSYTGPGCPPCQFTYGLSSVFFALGQFWVINQVSYSLMTSTDGIHWTNGTFPTPCQYADGIWSAGDYLYMTCLEDSGPTTYWVSTSVGSWQQVQGLDPSIWAQYVPGADVYVGLGSLGAVWYSNDGINFTPGAPFYDRTKNPDLLNFYGLAYGNGKWLAIGMFAQSDGPFGFIYGNFIYEASS